MGKRTEKLQVLVTGATGQLGTAIVNELMAQCEDEQSNPFLAKTREALDVTNFDEVRKQLKLLRPSAVIHAAGLSDWWMAQRNSQQAWKTIVTGTDNVVKACAFFSIPVVLVSCHSVFGLTYPGRPFVETDPVAPHNLLAHAYASAEHCVFRLGQCACTDVWESGWRYWVVRCGPLFSAPCAREWRCDLTTAAMRTSRASSTPDISLLRDIQITPTYAPHLAKALIWMTQHKSAVASGVYHISNRGAVSPYDFAVYLRQRLAWNGPLLRPVDRYELAELGGYDVSLVPRSTPLSTEKIEYMSPLVLPHWQEACAEFASIESVA